MDDVRAPSLDRAALVTIDVQRDTLDGQPLEVPGTSAAVPRIARLAAAFRAAGRPVVHVVRLYRADGSNAEPSRRALVSGPTPVLRPGTPGRLLAPGVLPAARGGPDGEVGGPDGEVGEDVELDDVLLLAGGLQPVGPGEVVVYKPRWGAFYRTPLDDHLRGLGVTTLVFAGCNFPNCPRTSIYEASERDYDVVVADDAVSGLYDRGRDELAGIGVRLLSTDAVVEIVAGASPPAAAWGTMDA
jgi:nicotinamidase-related amidase